MKTKLLLSAIICLLAVNTYSQEITKKDTLINSENIDTGVIPDKSNTSFDISNKYKDTKIDANINNPIDSINQTTYIEFKLHKPFYIPPYYTNLSPMFFGDYNTSGEILPNFYGSGMQTTIPGIGRINEASLMYQFQLNDYFDIQAGVSAIKYSLPFSIGQSFGTSGTIIYHPNERFRIKAFGTYSPDSRYNFNRSSFGGTIGYDFTDRFGMEVGAQRYYDPQEGWKTVPIVAPYYKFKRTTIGIDVGGILYEVIRNVMINKQQKNFIQQRTISQPSITFP